MAAEQETSPTPPLPETGGEPPDPRRSAPEPGAASASRNATDDPPAEGELAAPDTQAAPGERPATGPEGGTSAEGGTPADGGTSADGGVPRGGRMLAAGGELAAPDTQAAPGERPATGSPGGTSTEGGTSGGGGVSCGGRMAAGEATPTGGEGDGGRFTVRLANFEGPFDLLLQLIAKHKMDVTEVALSQVTDEFMGYIRAMGPDWDLDQTTEFLVVAATLLDLKAARLLPSAEVEDEADLALLEARDLLFARLLQYRAYKEIADIFSGRLDDEARRYPRTVGLEPHHAALLPEVVISIGAEGFAKLAVKAMQPRPRPQVYVDHIHAPLVSVQEQAEVVVARLRERGELRFQELVADAADTLTVVARFLALLELYREKAVALDQDEALADLLVRWTGGEGAEPVVTDEFDRASEVEDGPGAADGPRETKEKA